MFHCFGYCANFKAKVGFGDNLCYKIKHILYNCGRKTKKNIEKKENIIIIQERNVETLKPEKNNGRCQ